MQTCPAGEVRGSKRKDFERSFLGGTRALWRGGSQNPEGKNLAAREGSALSPAGSAKFCFSSPALCQLWL
jgi:hypothetical protein